MLIQVSSPDRGICAGLVVIDGEVVQAAPVLRFTLGWPYARLMRYLRHRGLQTAILG